MTMSNKWKLPADVTKLNPSDLSMPHVKTMLEFLGLALHNQPAKRDEKDKALKERIGQEPDKAQQAYDVIVHNKLPEARAEIVQDAEKMRAHFYSVMTKLLSSEQAESLRDSTSKHVESLVGKLESRLESYGKKVLKEASEHYRPVVIKEGKRERKVKGVLPQEFSRIVQLASQRVPIMLVGPAGCGKTYIASKLAEALDLPFYDQSCSEGVSESIFTGWLLPVTSGGAFNYVASPYIEAYEKGGVFLLDEMDASDANLLTFLNKSIANESFFLPQRHKNPLVKKHKDFVVVGAANTFGRGADMKYVGRNALDAATLDRFRAGMIHMDYSQEVESALVDGEVLEWGRNVRKCIYDNRLARIMSTRVMLDLTKMKQNCDWKLEDWERSYFADWSSDESALWKKAAETARAAKTGDSPTVSGRNTGVVKPSTLGAF